MNPEDFFWATSQDGPGVYSETGVPIHDVDHDARVDAFIIHLEAGTFARRWDELNKGKDGRLAQWLERHDEFDQMY